ncbi:MAG: hypothetical protein HQL66_07040 [Magnetococcales bacterium]|nr:hypothetical protein [Magnetococcales bacterium]
MVETTRPGGDSPIVIPIASSPAMMEGARVAPEVAWREKLDLLARHGEACDWVGVLRILTELSTSRRFPHTSKAVAQRAWVALKSDVPAIAAVTALREVVMTIGPRHELAGPMGALAYLLARHRRGDDAGREFAITQAQQTLHLICESQNVAAGGQAFREWVVANRLEEPEYYLPKVIDGLEIMVMGDWWFDRRALQEELNASNQGSAA